MDEQDAIHGSSSYDDYDVHCVSFSSYGMKVWLGEVTSILH
jgi:hypothetical protein